MAEPTKIAYYLMILHALIFYYIAKLTMGSEESTPVTGILYGLLWPVGIPLVIYELIRRRAIDTPGNKRYNTPWK